MSSTMRKEIFTVILTLGLGTLVHFGKSHMFSASFVELKAKQEQIIFLSKKEKWIHFAKRTFSYELARHDIEKKKALHSYIYFFLNSKFEIKVILKEEPSNLRSEWTCNNLELVWDDSFFLFFFFFFEVSKDENLSSPFHLLSPQNCASAWYAWGQVTLEPFVFTWRLIKY